MMVQDGMEKGGKRTGEKGGRIKHEESIKIDCLRYASGATQKEHYRRERADREGRRKE